MKNKSFIIVVVLIALVIGFGIWKTTYKNNEEDIIKPSKSGDETNISGEASLDKVKYVNDINSYVEEINKNSGDMIQYNTLATIDELGSDISKRTIYNMRYLLEWAENYKYKPSKIKQHKLF